MNNIELIIDFQSSQELDDYIASSLIAIFQEPGLIMLPVGNTFAQGIYPAVNKYFAEEIIESHTLAQYGQESFQQKKIHPELKITHIDELVFEEKPANSFAKQLQASLPNVMKQLGDNFHAINTQQDPNYAKEFEIFCRTAGGPKIILLGVGKDPDFAHVAFMGEEYINSTARVINLSEAVSQSHGTQKAFTIGADIFETQSLEKIVVVAKGKDKAASIERAFNDEDTGLGYLIKKHSNKLKIFIDHEVANNISL